MSALVARPRHCSEPGAPPPRECNDAHFKIKHLAMRAALRVSLGASLPFHVTWSDSDCLWLRRSYLSWLDEQMHLAPRALTLLAQRGMDARHRVVQSVGCLASNGLYTLFPTAGAEQLMAEAEHAMFSSAALDDQLIFNDVLDAGGAFDFPQRRLPYMLSGRDAPIDFSVEASRYRIGLLNYEEFPRGAKLRRPSSDRGLSFWTGAAAAGEGTSQEWRRIYLCDPARRPLVWHLQAPKNGTVKQRAMAADGVWALSGDWAGIRTRAALEGYLAQQTPPTLHDGAVHASCAAKSAGHVDKGRTRSGGRAGDVDAMEGLPAALARPPPGRRPAQRDSAASKPAPAPTCWLTQWGVDGFGHQLFGTLTLLSLDGLSLHGQGLRYDACVNRSEQFEHLRPHEALPVRAYLQDALGRACAARRPAPPSLPQRERLSKRVYNTGWHPLPCAIDTLYLLDQVCEADPAARLASVRQELQQMFLPALGPPPSHFAGPPRLGASDAIRKTLDAVIHVRGGDAAMRGANPTAREQLPRIVDALERRARHSQHGLRVWLHTDSPKLPAVRELATAGRVQLCNGTLCGATVLDALRDMVWADWLVLTESALSWAAAWLNERATLVISPTMTWQPAYARRPVPVLPEGTLTFEDVLKD